MCQLVDAIYSLGQRDWFDYLSIIAPLVLSFIAVYISIATARKQNRIALFDMRCRAIHTIKLILAFGDGLRICGCNEAIVDLFNTTFGTQIDISTYDSIDCSREARNCMHNIGRDLLAATSIFPQKHIKPIEKILAMENDYIYEVIEDGMKDAQQKTIQKKCAIYRRDHLGKLMKSMQL